MRKPMLSAEEIVEKLDKDKGVKFEIVSKEEAIEHLRNSNNYLRTACYRINYEKRDGKYVNLDFAYLIELSRLDMHLRAYFLKMAIDVEHSLKLKILEIVENASDEDGYLLVSDFLKDNKYLLQNITKKKDASFTKDLINKYFKYDEGTEGLYNNDCPIWALVEVVSFGDLVKLYYFCCERCDVPAKNIVDKNALNLTKSIRNACAHNNCILRDFRKTSDTYPPQIISMYASRINNVRKEARYNKLSVRVILEITALFYCYEKLVPETTRYTYESELKDFAKDRLIKNIKYFDKNEKIKSALLYISYAIDKLN